MKIYSILSLEELSGRIKNINVNLEVMRELDLDFEEYAILNIIIQVNSFLDESSCFLQITRNEIALFLNVSKRTIQRKIKKLKELNLIFIENIHFGILPTEYAMQKFKNL